MLSELWLKDKHPCLFFVKVHKRWESEEKADGNLNAKMYRLKIPRKI